MVGLVHKDLKEKMLNQGYRYIGRGIDKQAWLDDKNKVVILICGYRYGYKTLSPEQISFIDWVQYCKKNLNNKHLPKYHNIEIVEHKKRTYVFVTMEFLEKLGHSQQDVVNYFGFYIKKNKNILDHTMVLKKIGEAGIEIFDSDENKFLFQKVNYNKVIHLLGGKTDAVSLLDTFCTLVNSDKQIDIILANNLMQRQDGTIVFIDPYINLHNFIEKVIYFIFKSIHFVNIKSKLFKVT
jgi:hypothetical protein